MNKGLFDLRKKIAFAAALVFVAHTMCVMPAAEITAVATAQTGDRSMAGVPGAGEASNEDHETSKPAGPTVPEEEQDPPIEETTTTTTSVTTTTTTTITTTTTTTAKKTYKLIADNTDINSTDMSFLLGSLFPGYVFEHGENVPGDRERLCTVPANLKVNTEDSWAISNPYLFIYNPDTSTEDELHFTVYYKYSMIYENPKNTAPMEAVTFSVKDADGKETRDIFDYYKAGSELLITPSKLYTANGSADAVSVKLDENAVLVREDMETDKFVLKSNGSGDIVIAPRRFTLNFSSHTDYHLEDSEKKYSSGKQSYSVRWNDIGSLSVRSNAGVKKIWFEVRSGDTVKRFKADDNGSFNLDKILETEEFGYKNDIKLTVSGIDESVKVIVKYFGSDDIVDQYIVPVTAENAGFTYEVPVLYDEDRFLKSYIYAGDENDIYQNVFTALEKNSNCIGLGYRNDMTSVTLIYKKFAKSGDDAFVYDPSSDITQRSDNCYTIESMDTSVELMKFGDEFKNKRAIINTQKNGALKSDSYLLGDKNKKIVVTIDNPDDSGFILVRNIVEGENGEYTDSLNNSICFYLDRTAPKVSSVKTSADGIDGGWSGRNGLDVELSVTDNEKLDNVSSSLSYFDKKELQNIYDRFINAGSGDSREINSIIAKNYRFDRPENGWRDTAELKPYVETEDMRTAEAAVINELFELPFEKVDEKYSDYENTYGYFRTLLRKDASGLRSDLRSYYRELIAAEQAKLDAADELEDDEKAAAVKKLKASITGLTQSAEKIDSLLDVYIIADKNKSADSHCIPKLSFDSDGRFVINFTADSEKENAVIDEYITISAVDNSYNISSENAAVHVRIDGQAPVVKNDKISAEGAPNAQGSSSIFVLKEGAYIIAEADDMNGSGVRQLTLALGEETDGQKMYYDRSRGGYIYKISDTDLNGKNRKIPAIIVAEDNMGNKAYWKSSEKGDKFSFIIDDEKPICSIKDISDENKTYTEVASQSSKTWFREFEDIVLSISAEDVNPDICSGIEAIDITINDRSCRISVADKSIDIDKLKNGDYRLVFAKGSEKERFNVELVCGEVRIPVGEEYSLHNDGSIHVKLTASDYAGKTSNMAELSSFMDSSVPKVTGLNLNGRNIISDGGSFEYREFASGEAQLEIVVEEGEHSSGIGSIEVTFSDKNSGEESTRVIENKDSPHRKSFILTIPADFKGTVSAKAVSNVTRSSEDVLSCGIITESYSKHMETSSAKVELPVTPYKDALGNPLYSGDVKATLIVQDSFSGIGSIDLTASGHETESYVIPSEDGEWEITDRDEEGGLVKAVKRDITVSENTNGNTIKLGFGDNARNYTSMTEPVRFSIDKTVPEVKIRFTDENGADEKSDSNIFSKERRAVIEVTERNFDEERMEVTVNGVKEKLEWKLTGGAEGTDTAVYSAVREFKDDGDYLLKVNCTDMCDQKAEEKTASFIIDTTPPVLKEAFDGSIANEHYYNQAVKAVFTITDKNFDPRLIEVSGTYNGSSYDFPAFSSWQTIGSESSASVDFSRDGEYVVRISGKDKAGNQMEAYTGRFCIDSKKPSIGVGEVIRSNNGSEIRPRIVFEDTNIDKDSIKVKVDGANRGNNLNLGGTLNEVAGGYEYVFDNIPDKEENDDIYKVKASAKDNADNKIEKDFQFSVNRYGSVFEIDDDTRKIRGRFIANEQDIIITERNPDAHASPQNVFITKDSEMIELKEGEDYSVKYRGGDDEWSEYVYTVFAKNFEKDAKYSVSIHSRDAAGNINISDSDKKNADVEFYIDKTEPLCIPLNIAENTAYKNESITARLSVTDNLILKEIHVFIDGKEVRRSYYNDECTFEIPNSSHSQDIKIVLTDMADNVREYEYKNILVTKNGMRILIHKTWFKVCCGVVALLAAAAAVFIRKWKKRLY
ncbi:MAG: hypothetical protein J6U00_12490 [Ruminococcus sp.]|uniref:hypothetical protein n=1 Tax=Ruminococcus sp. TaxID=41978 RepID=UPI001B2E7C34|nr:hypothetical protein [Ruminococcus sp.]MBO7474790.1 hypothetical protein [Ruminococcus sp.]